MCVTPSIKVAISETINNKLVLWDCMTKMDLKILVGHTDSITCVSMTPDGKRAVSGGSHGNLILWDLESGEIPFIRKEEEIVLA